MQSFKDKNRKKQIFGTLSVELASGRRSILLDKFLDGPVVLVKSREDIVKYGVSTLLHWKDDDHQGLSDLSSHGIDTLYLQDGPVRSVGFPNKDALTASLRVFKRLTDSIESCLNNKFYKVSTEQKVQTAEFVHLMNRLNISKYNCFEALRPGWVNKSAVRDRIIILLDTMMSSGMERERKMLYDARKEFPKAQILVRAHPISENIQVSALGHHASEVAADWCNSMWNPIAALKEIDVVYTVNSELGFQAALLGKKVYCYGNNFYNGRGFTVDRTKSQNLKLQRDVLEVAYAFFIDNLIYIDITENKHCSPQYAIWKIIRKRYLNTHISVLSQKYSSNISALRSITGDYPYSHNEIEKDLEANCFQMQNAKYLIKIKSKRVALVGPANTLRGTGKGKIIDQYDIVVRLNHCIRNYPFKKQIAEDIGSKLDILYITPGTIGQLHRVNFSESFEKLSQINEIIVIDPLFDALNGLNLENLSERLRNLRSKISKVIRVESLTPFILARWLGGYPARVGCTTILDLLIHEPAKLYVTGFTFYQGGGHTVRDVNCQLTTTQGPYGELTNHNSERELQVLKILRHLYPETLCIDQTLSDLVDSL